MKNLENGGVRRLVVEREWRVCRKESAVVVDVVAAVLCRASEKRCC